MRYDTKIKEILPNGCPYSIDSENYLKDEMKRRIVLDMIDKLPFEIYEKQLSYGTEYTVSIDVEIEEWSKYLRKMAFLNNTQKTN